MKFDKLLKTLQRRDLPMEVRSPFYDLGKSAYEQLFASLNLKELTDLQIGNMLRLLLDLRAVGDREELFDKLLEFALEDRVRVRSAAIRIILTILYNSDPPARKEFQRVHDPEVLEVVRKALALGLDRPTEDDVKRFLSNPSIDGAK